VTNVDLSAVAKTGGIDSVETLVASLLNSDEAAKAGLRARDFKIWHADQVRTMIDAHQDVRWAFDGLLTVGDVLAALAAGRLAPSASSSLEELLREDLLKGLSADRWVRLSQAGAAGDMKLHVDEVAIDLPATVDSREGTSAGSSTPLHALQHVLSRGDSVLSARQPQGAGPAGIVLVGGPGQGKSTISQLIAQAYRASMLEDADLAPSAAETVTATNAALARLGTVLPRNRRSPVRVDLAKFAEELSAGAQTGLLAWIARAVVSRRTSQPVTPHQLKGWLRVCPWVLVLDGLDEVPSLSSRRAVYVAVEEFFVDADDVGADVLVVVTTRPTGYDERLPEDQFEHLILQPLPVSEAAELAERLTAQRFVEDEEMRAQVATRMRDAASDPTTARLMTTPLQVTVMSVIVEKFPTLPPDRFTLFDLYYGTIFDREVAKAIASSRFLNEHRQHVNRLHELVGLELQVRSEAADGAEAVLPTDELRSMAEAHLTRAGYETAQAQEKAAQLVVASTHRLVLIVPREAGVGFEIRTLQELMAARALVEGADDQVIARLRVIADSAHWRNTWLLAAGKILTTSDRFQAKLIEVLKSLDSNPTGLGQVSSRAAIAADLLNDGLGQRRPAFELSLANAVLSARDRAPVGRMDGIADALNLLMATRHRELVIKYLRAASSPLQRASAAALFDETRAVLGQFESGRTQTVVLARGALRLSVEEEAAHSASVTLTTFVGPFDVATMPDRLQPVAGEWAELARKAGKQEEFLVRDAILENLRSVEAAGEAYNLAVAGLMGLGQATYIVAGATVLLRSVPRTDPELILASLDEPDCAVLLELALATLPQGDWPVAALLSHLIDRALGRRRRGLDLQALMAQHHT